MNPIHDWPEHEQVAFGDIELGQGVDVLMRTLEGLDSLPF
jgi:hypothetical protein